MCVSVSPANFYDTALMVSPAQHPVTGKPIVVMAYQNKVQNLTKGGNAMLLHFPAKSNMNKENIVDTEDYPYIVSDMIKVLVAPFATRGMTKEIKKSKSVEIFDSGIYTIVMSNDADAIPKAIERVRPDRRPKINSSLFKWYGKTFPEWKFALCCFSNSDVKTSTPMIWWYESIYEDKLMLPGIDCHTGNVPNLSERVDVNH